ncbi:hypothetical protein [Marinicella meishanensis]|uniref:hypothetical protein n=1 Tax=Marinicella meishanensis TaxID=2873263 RepID=UPI001CC054F1|nr:hypothetical protein [Marinicella sp. NBU2979]
MGYRIRFHLLWLSLMAFPQALWSAVSLSQNQQGQALVVPYYTVANGLNTLVSINNHQNHPKALKIHLKDGRLGANIQSFNVYLGAHESWNFAMAEDPNGPLILSSDNSCALNLDTGASGQPTTSEPSWDRLVGVIEVIEMGQVLTESNDFFGNLTEQENCQRLADAWYAQGPNSFWQAESSAEMAPANGGLSAAVSVIDVSNGWAINIPTLAFNDFFAANTIHHRSPEAAEPNLASGSHDSLLLHQGQVMQTTWPTGHEAISALLMTTGIENAYDLSLFVAAENDFILSFPTWSYHRDQADSQKPFITNPVHGFLFGTSYRQRNPLFHYDHTGQQERGGYGGSIDPHPPEVDWILPGVTMTFAVNDSYDVVDSFLSGEIRDNVSPLGVPISAEYKGRVKFAFAEYNSLGNDRGIDAHTGTPQTYHGLPVTGFMGMKFYNAGAGPGLLATYAWSNAHSSDRHINDLTGENHAE